MSSLQQIKKRIRSLETTKKITHAMKHVSTVRFRRAQRALIAARPYSEQLINLLSRISARDSTHTMHPFMEQREIKKAILVVITSDRGMCGAFNSNLLREAEKFIREKEAEGVKIELALIGRKGYDYFRHNNYDLLHNYPGVFENLSYQKAAELADGFAASYLKHDMDALFFIYHEFDSMAHQSIVIKEALPIMPLQPEAAGEEQPAADEYIFEPDSQTLLDKLAALYLAYHLWRTLLESSASEHAARMNAMEAAAHNEAEMREKLLLSYNRARQEAVTTELLDIIGGAGALGN